MKIFNWVHRRFVHKDGVPQNGKKVNIDEGDQFLVVDENNNKMMNGFSGWKLGGILTIGTFGYDPILSLQDDDHLDHQINEQDDDVTNTLIYAPTEKVITDHHASDDEDEEDHQYDGNEDEEENPLLYAVHARDYGYSYNYNQEGLLEMKMEESRVSHEMPDNNNVNDDYYLFDADHTKKERRTTLADLFSKADNSKDNITHDLHKKQAPNVINNKEAAMVKEKSPNGCISSANKLDARPIHKLHRLMRRMMKRKIHPTADHLIGLNKLDDYYPTLSKVAIGESASLLSVSN